MHHPLINQMVAEGKSVHHRGVRFICFQLNSGSPIRDIIVNFSECGVNNNSATHLVLVTQYIMGHLLNKSPHDQLAQSLASSGMDSTVSQVFIDNVKVAQEEWNTAFGARITENNLLNVYGQFNLADGYAYPPEKYNDCYLLTDLTVTDARIAGKFKKVIPNLDTLSDEEIRAAVFYICFQFDNMALPHLQRIQRAGGRYFPP